MFAADDEKSTNAPAGTDGAASDTETKRPSAGEVIDQAKKRARGIWGVLRAIIRPLLPKKWTPRSIFITAVVVLVLLILASTLINSLMWIIKWLLVATLVAAGVYFLAFAGRR